MGALAAPHPVDEIVPPSQIPGLNLTHSTILGILDQMWHSIYLDLQLGPAGPKTCSIEQSIEAPQQYRPSSLAPDMN